MFNKVFISYAKEDYDFAEKLFIYLSENGFIPWLDKQRLLPGQQWDFEIKKGLREANYVILLLSDNSVQKRGYVQREFKLALKFYEEKLEDDIYLIPLKINKCIVPESLSSFQWIEIENYSFDSILQSLTSQQCKYLAFHEKQLNKHRTFDIKEIKEEFLYIKKGISIKIETLFFQFTDVENQSLNELNKFIAGQSVAGVLSGRNYLLGEEDHDLLNHNVTNTWYFESSYLLHFLNTSIVSIIENTYNYTGGAHGSTGILGYSFYISPAYKLDLKNLFLYEDHQKVLEFISDYCFNELRNIYNEGLELSEQEIKTQDKSIFWENSLDPVWENFENFIISKKNISIIFNQYQVSSYAFGMHTINIPFEELKKLSIDIGPLLKLEEKLK